MVDLSIAMLDYQRVHPYPIQAWDRQLREVSDKAAEGSNRSNPKKVESWSTNDRLVSNDALECTYLDSRQIHSYVYIYCM